MYNEKYSLQEDMGLSKLNRVLENANRVEYKHVGNAEILQFIEDKYANHGYGDDGMSSWESSYPVRVSESYIAQIIRANGESSILDIFGDTVYMTPVLVQKCEQLLYRYKLQHSKSEPDYEEIVQAEQSRDVYQNLPQFKKEKFFTQQDTPELFIKNMKVKPLNWFARKAIGFANADKSADRITTIYRENNKWYINYPCKKTSLCGDIIPEWHRDLPIEFNSVAGAFYMAKAAGFKRNKIR